MTQTIKAMLTKITAVLAFAFWSNNLAAQVKPETVQSVFIYSAIKYMEWSDDSRTEFVIVVFGNSPIYAELSKIAQSKKAGTKNIVVRQVDDLKEITDCHILCVPSNKLGALRSSNFGAQSASTLIIAECESNNGKEGDLCFSFQGNKLVFKLNEKSLANKKIKISSAFVTLAQK